jgi:hypothetical protein
VEPVYLRKRHWFENIKALPRPAVIDEFSFVESNN